MTSSPTENDAAEKDQVRSKSDFSIDHILNRAGNSASERKSFENSSLSVMPFPWLHCTRYCPPKIPRHSKREAPQKRQLGRHPRIPFTSQQLAVLEEKFRLTPYLSSTEVTKISRSLQLADIRVKIWFQNRRARERRERTQLETEEQKLQSTNSSNSIPTSQECRSSSSQSSAPDAEEYSLVNKNSSFVATVPSIFPVLQNYPVYDGIIGIRNAQYLRYSSSVISDDYN